MPTRKVRKLSDKETAFVTQYLLDKNATQAAIRAGYSARSAKQRGYLLLRRIEVRDAVDALLAAQARRTLITADQVLLDINDIADEARNVGELGTAIAGKKLVGMHYKLFTERHEHGGIGGGPVQLVITNKEADL